MRLSSELSEQPRPVPSQTLEEREQAGPVHLLAQTSGRRFFEMVGLVDDEVVELRQQPASHLRVREQKRMVDHNQVRGFCLGARAVDVAILFRAVNPDAVERVGGDVGPQDLLAPVEPQLRAIAAGGRVQPEHDLELELQVVGVLARLSQEPAPAPQRNVIRPPLEQARLEIPRQPLAQPGQVLDHQLLLQRVRVRRDDHPLPVADRSRDRGHEVREALARAGPGLHDQGAAASLDLGDGEQHLELGLAVLISGQQAGQRSIRAEQSHQEARVVRGGRGRLAAGRLDHLVGGRAGIWIGRGQRLGEEAGDRPVVGRDQGQHRLLERLIENRGFLPQPEQQLPGRVGVVEGAVWSRLVETHLRGKQRKAVAGRRGQEDAGHVQGVEDLRLRGPEAGRRQEVDVEPSAVPDRLAAAQEIGQLAQCRLGGGGAPELLGFDAGQPKHGFGHGATGIHQAFESRRDPLRGESDRAHLDHSISGRVEPGRLEIEGCVFGHRSRFYVMAASLLGKGAKREPEVPSYAGRSTADRGLSNCHGQLGRIRAPNTLLQIGLPQIALYKRRLRAS